MVNIVQNVSRVGLCAALVICATASADPQPNAHPSAIQNVTIASTENAVDWSNLAPLDVHARTSLNIVEQLRHSHYLRKDLDDDVSSQVFEKYLELLDGARVYFLASDVARFEDYRYTLDDALKRGNLDPAFTIFNTYQERLIGRFEYLLAELGEGLASYDFTIEEDIEITRENAAWPKTEEEHDNLWRKRLKAAALSMKLNGKEISEINKLLTKRYTNYRIRGRTLFLHLRRDALEAGRRIVPGHQRFATGRRMANTLEQHVQIDIFAELLSQALAEAVAQPVARLRNVPFIFGARRSFRSCGTRLFRLLAGGKK